MQNQPLSASPQQPLLRTDLCSMAAAAQGIHCHPSPQAQVNKLFRQPCQDGSWPSTALCLSKVREPTLRFARFAMSHTACVGCGTGVEEEAAQRRGPAGQQGSSRRRQRKRLRPVYQDAYDEGKVGTAQLLAWHVA